MQSKTISITLGKGSISHNTRTFIADNVDPNRTPLNVEFANQDIKQAYHHLFDVLVSKLNIIWCSSWINIISYKLA